MATTHEQKFTKALRDILVGAKIEGDRGYINLMRIKSRYYTEGVFPKLMEKIDAEIKPFPAFREELFDKLFTFFKRYFSDSGSIHFRHTPYYQDIYERIYTDDRNIQQHNKELFVQIRNLPKKARAARNCGNTHEATVKNTPLRAQRASAFFATNFFW